MEGKERGKRGKRGGGREKERFGDIICRETRFKRKKNKEKEEREGKRAPPNEETGFTFFLLRDWTTKRESRNGSSLVRLKAEKEGEKRGQGVTLIAW